MWVSIAELKLKKIESGHFTFLKCYIQDTPSRKQYQCFFRGARGISRINDFFLGNMGEERKIKTNETRKMKFCALKML